MGSEMCIRDRRPGASVAAVRDDECDAVLVLPVRCDAEGALLQLIPERLDIVVREGPRMPQKTRTQIPAASIVESWRRPPKTIVSGELGSHVLRRLPLVLAGTCFRRAFLACPPTGIIHSEPRGLEWRSIGSEPVIAATPIR